jgi:ribonucleoside-diphosphate reductase alpha chain
VVGGTQERRVTRRRAAVTRSFTVGGAAGYLLTSRYPDGAPADLRLIMGRPGTTLHGLLDTISVAISTGLQNDVPLATFVSRFAGVRFDPAGPTDDPEIPRASSVVDYVVRRLAWTTCPSTTAWRSACSRRSSEPPPCRTSRGRPRPNRPGWPGSAANRRPSPGPVLGRGTARPAGRPSTPGTRRRLGDAGATRQPAAERHRGPVRSR